MNVRNCRRCRKLFNYVTGPFICPQCRDEMEQDFQKVKAYLQENPRSDIRTVSEACEVDQDQIRQWVREERLEFSSESGAGITCEKCGKPITSGKMCQECKNSLSASLGNIVKQDQDAKARAAEELRRRQHDSQGNKMRFI